MKKTPTIVFMSMICFLAIFSCKDNQPAAETGKTATAKTVKLKEEESAVQMPLDSATQAIHRYDSICEKYLGVIPIRAYTIRAQDLTQALGLPDTIRCAYDHVRVYLGMDKRNQFKIFFTPVINASLNPDDMQAGTDVILGHIDSDPHSGYVLDLNAPCPTTCDQTSPLFNPN